MSIHIHTEPGMRPLLPALTKGAACRCPACGQGRLFRAYLKVEESCSACGEELHHHRADDLPPYIAIFIVGHVLVGLLLHIEMSMQVQPLVYMLTLVPLALLLPLLMLPSIKGSVVGLQWAMRMHGFDSQQRDPATPDAV